MENKHCSHCGTEHVSESYPKKCPGCKRETWNSPKPVAVLLQPVNDFDNDRRGILLGKRAIEPFIGHWALIGGYIDPNDPTVIEAALREFHEETGIELYAALYRTSMNIVSSYGDGRFLLLFVESTLGMDVKNVDKFVPNSECSEIRVAWEPEELCFVSHTAALKNWFERENRD
jgi:8-oxo-dGTP pyrophosphatase MutT (NUDIX family)